MVSFQCKKDKCSTEGGTAAAQRLRSAGMGMMVSAMGVLIGLTAGLSSSIGFGSAMAIGIGASVGLFAAGRSMIKRGNGMTTAECTEGGEDVEEGKEEATADA